jgi:polyhydroxyalkanoate synthase
MGASMVENKTHSGVNIAKISELMSQLLSKQKGILSFFAKKYAVSVDLKRDYSVDSEYSELLMKCIFNPGYILKAQQRFISDYSNLVECFMDNLLGFDEPKESIGAKLADKRFKSPEWDSNQFYAFLRDFYLITSHNINRMVSEIDGIDEQKKKKIVFFTKQITDALSPSNFLLTNPELMKITFETGGDNLIKGFENFINDVNSVDGNISIKMTDTQAFELGKNLATTPGKVIFQNELMQLIQYEPLTEEVFSTPILISPPWINKFYILDLNESNSLVRWLVKKGYTVFMISWVNCDSGHAHLKYEDYMTEGHLKALDIIKEITGEKKVSAMGYCTGGTLLASTAAYLAGTGEDRFASLTYLATLMDFSNPGDLGIFVDRDQFSDIQKTIKATGFLDGRQLAQTFNMLRSNELIWTYVVNNYLKGKTPVPFDILYWNSDSTNLPANMYVFYLNKMYIQNKLKEPGGIILKGVPIDLSAIMTPAYFLTTEDDHIVLWKGSYNGCRIHSGPVRFVLAGSGHVAGVINPPDKNKYGYRFSESLPESPDEWLEASTWRAGSWWNNWLGWNREYAGVLVKKKMPGNKRYKAIEDAPGSYVKKELGK